MDIFEFAKEKEKLSEERYRELGKNTDIEGLRNIFNMLADEEIEHFKVVERMQKRQHVKVAETEILNNAKTIFDSMRKSAGEINFKMDEATVYKKAKKYEAESENFYREKAKEVSDPAQKEIFNLLAKMEHRHYILLENIYSFVEKPKYFLENAEMYRFDDYAEGQL
jgi:rubrerythrin